MFVHGFKGTVMAAGFEEVGLTMATGHSFVFFVGLPTSIPIHLFGDASAQRRMQVERK